MRALLAAYLVGCCSGIACCSGSSTTLEQGPSCSAGVLTVSAPASEIRARFPDVSTTHRCEPPMHFRRADDGALVFTPEREAPRYVIESRAYGTSEPLCPLEIEVRP